MKKFLALALVCIMVLALMPTFASAAENVVYVKDGGTGDGSSADKAVGTLTEAWNALSPDTDGTVVVCGPLTVGTFNYSADGGADRDTKVTVTSVYGDKDYRKDGAKINLSLTWSCTGETVFDDLTIEMAAKANYIICRNYDVTIGEGVEIIPHASTTGLGTGNAFVIISGSSNNAAYPNRQTDSKVTVTVLAGEMLYLVPGSFNKALGNTNDVEFVIGGEAYVGIAMTSAYGAAQDEVGNLTFTVKDNALVNAITGYNKPQTVKSLTVNWEGGDIINASIYQYSNNSSNVEGNSVTFTNGATLNYAKDKESDPVFAAISQGFTVRAVIGDAPVVTDASVVTTEAPAVTDAPVVTTEAPIVTTGTQTDAPATGSYSYVAAIVLVAAVAACGAIVVAKKRIEE